MQPVLSNRVLSMKPSSLYAFFRKVKAKIAAGEDVINLGLGEPEENTPDSIKLAGIRAIIENKTKYVPSHGSSDLREKIARKYNVGLEEVVVSHSAKILNWVLFATTNPGDGILIPSPYFPPYVEVVKGLELKPVLIETEKNNFKLTAEAVKLAIENCLVKPKVLIINTPNNPTGVNYSQEELKKISRLAREEGIIIIADECYSSYSKTPNFSFRLIDPTAVIVCSSSKNYVMTGWRLGWGIMPSWLAEKVELVLDHFIGPPSSIAERAVFHALDLPIIEGYNEQREILMNWFKKMSIQCVDFDSAFYAFPNFSSYIERVGGSIKLAEMILEKGVAITPGNAFGDYEDYIRIAYCVSSDKLICALEIIEKTLSII